MRIRSRKKSEFRSHERNHLFDHYSRVAATIAKYKRVAATIAKGHSTSHDMRESNLDGDQDLSLRSLEDVLREVLDDDLQT